MAFTSGVLEDVPGGGALVGKSCYCKVGWFKNTLGSTGGTIETHFPTCYILTPQVHAAAVGNGPVVNMVTADVEVGMSGSVVIVTDADAVGRWIAFGA